MLHEAKLSLPHRKGHPILAKLSTKLRSNKEQVNKIMNAIAKQVIQLNQKHSQVLSRQCMGVACMQCYPLNCKEVVNNNLKHFLFKEGKKKKKGFSSDL